MRSKHPLSRRSFCKRCMAGAGSLAGGYLSGCSSLSPVTDRGSSLASAWDERRDFYDAVVVGSGYGGSILAARLASPQAGGRKSVCLLERGREWRTGEFPDTDRDVVRALRSPAVNPLGLYDFHVSPDLCVFSGCGLGGTSLINGNVATVPDAEVFEDPRWPAGITLEVLEPYYALARDALSAGPHPRYDEFLRVAALQRRAAELSTHAEALDLTVNFDIDGKNQFGVAQTPCIDCGDCVTGCNVGAKNTLVTNYLPLAKSHGAHIFVRTEVDWVEKLPGGSWRVHGRRIGRWGARTPFTVEAANVVLSAGALGTTEILLRSQANGLSVSRRLGESFSGNGDFLGIGYNADSQTNVLGFGNAPSSPWRANAPGPSLLGGIRYNVDRPMAERFIVEDTAIPSALLKEVMFFFDALPGVDTDAGDTFREALRRNLNRVDPPLRQHNALNHTMMYLVMAHERADGRIRLDGRGRARVEPSGAGRQDIFETINRELYEHARANGARFISNPVWQFLDLKSLITVHPSGGCAMGDRGDDGVVDEYGQVFAVGGATQPGLRVADASVFPTSLGVNPLLTIAALSERIADHMKTEGT